MYSNALKRGQYCFFFLFWSSARFLVSHLHHLNRMQFIWYGIILTAATVTNWSLFMQHSIFHEREEAMSEREREKKKSELGKLI